MPFIRHGLGTKIRLRRIPELDVRLDDSIERGTRVLQIINELEAGRTPDVLEDSGESLPTPVPRLRQDGDTVEVPPSSGPSVEPAPKPRTKRSRRSEFGHGVAGSAGRSGARRRTR
jgi:hypothetical protein